MMHQRALLVTLAASAGMDQCHSFKQVRRRYALPEIRSTDRLYRQRRHDTIEYYEQSLLSIRGGNVDYDKEESGNTAYDFIASFESELAEIRREAEIEAENEMEKIRELIEGRGDEVEGDEVGSEGNENANALDDDADMVVSEGEEGRDYGSVEEREHDQTLPDEGQEEAIPSETESEEVPPEQEVTEIVDDPNVESDAEDGMDDEAVLLGNQPGVTTDLNEDSDSAAEPDIDDAISIVDVVSSDDERVSADEGEDTKPTQPKKKKRKSSKKGKKGKRTKPRMLLSEDSELSDGGQVDLGETVLLTRHAQDDVDRPLEKGIWFYLRSDLGRAIGMFIATVLLAILTQRLQRQMEAEGI